MTRAVNLLDDFKKSLSIFIFVKKAYKINISQSINNCSVHTPMSCRHFYFHLLIPPPFHGVVKVGT